MEIRKIAKNEFKPFGMVTVSDKKTKSVEVDGETYYKTEHGIKEVECSEYFNFYEIELDELECFGYKATIHDYEGIYTSVFRIASGIQYNLSSNNYVFYWLWLFENGHLPKWVKNVFTSKKMYVRDYGIGPYCLWRICDYGFNNNLYDRS